MNRIPSIWWLIGTVPVGVLLVAGVAASAHEAPSKLWSYPYSCCSGDATTGDCQEISSEAVEDLVDGYHVTLRPGDHRLITVLTEIVIPYALKRPSPDGGWHICTTASTPFWRCFFGPEPAT